MQNTIMSQDRDGKGGTRKKMNVYDRMYTQVEEKPA